MTAVALVLAALFGAADQYIGSLSAHPLGADISQLSAPWLLLPFIVGALQRSPRRAMAMGVGCTLAALVGYMLMTLSPVENARLTVRSLTDFVRYGNFRWFLGGVVTGPLFAWLGHRWRTRSALAAGLVMAVVVCLEPSARHLYGNVIGSRMVSGAEVAFGAAMVLAVLLRAAVKWRAVS